MRIALPKGRLLPGVVARLEEVGIHLAFTSERDYQPSVSESGITARLFKPRAIPQLVALGHVPLGFAGLDLIREADYENNEPRLDLSLNRVELVVALSEDTPELLADPPRRPLIIATEFVNIAHAWALEKGIAHIVIQTWGSTEAYVPQDADIVLDVVETGATMQANRLMVIERLLVSTTHAFTGLQPTPETMAFLRQLAKVLQ